MHMVWKHAKIFSFANKALIKNLQKKLIKRKICESYNLSIPINVWNEKSENYSQNHFKSAKNEKKKWK